MANLRRNNTITINSGSYTAPGASYLVNAYPAGAIASTTNTTIVGSTIVHTVFAGHNVVAGDYLMKGLDTTQVALVDSVTATTITLHSTTLTSVKDTVLINIGPDTNVGASPSWTQAGTPRVQIYSTPDTTTPITYAITSCDSGGNYGYWYDTAAIIWEVVRNGTTPVGYFIQNSATLLTTSGSPFVDNAITRWDGIGGLTLQSAYSSNTPTITDAGAITAAGTHSFGPITVTGAAAVTGALSAAGTTVTTLTTTGAAALGSGVTVTGTSTLNGAVTTSSTLTTGGATTLTAGNTTINHLICGTSAPTLVTTANFALSGAGWGTGATISAASGNDTRCTVTITAGSASPTYGPIFTFTYTGTTAYAVPPLTFVTLAGGTCLNTGSGQVFPATPVVTTSTSLIATITFQGTAVVNKTYVFNILTIG